jgi:hypothetical protein
MQKTQATAREPLNAGAAHARQLSLGSDVSKRGPRAAIQHTFKYLLRHLCITVDQIPVTHTVPLSGDTEIISGGGIEQTVGRLQSFVHQHTPQVGVVFNNVHVRVDHVEQGCGLVGEAQSHQ